MQVQIICGVDMNTEQRLDLGSPLGFSPASRGKTQK